MNAVTMIQKNLSNKTTAELLDMGQVTKGQRADENARIISAAITEELITRNPQVLPAVEAWGEDLDTDADLIDVITEALAA